MKQLFPMPNEQQLKIFKNIMVSCLSLHVYKNNNEVYLLWFQVAERGVATVLFL